MKSTILTLLSTFNFLRFIKHNAVLLQHLHEPRVWDKDGHDKSHTLKKTEHAKSPV